MLEDVDAVRYDRVMRKGKTRPVLLACERSTGAEVEVIAKFSVGCENSTAGLIREAMSSMLAADLQLPIAEPFVVHVSPEFIATIPDTAVVEYLSKSVPLGFGTKRLPDGFNAWSKGPKLGPTLVQQALEIIAFDALITNPDRTTDNPNLLFDGRALVMIDHDRACPEFCVRGIT